MLMYPTPYIVEEGICRMLLLSKSRGTPAIRLLHTISRLYNENIKASAFQVYVAYAFIHFYGRCVACYSAIVKRSQIFSKNFVIFN